MGLGFRHYPTQANPFGYAQGWLEWATRFRRTGWAARLEASSYLFMTNSRDRRKLRRQLQEAGRGHLLRPQSDKPAPIAAPPSELLLRFSSFFQFWRKVRWWAWLGVIVLATAITLLEGYPWLSVSEGAALSTQNPFSTLFYVTNDGYLPVDNLNANCSASFDDGHGNHFNSIGSGYPQFAHRLNHSGRATIPCFRMIELKNIGPLTHVSLSVTITYSAWPFSCHACRRHQVFLFSGVTADNGQTMWTFVS